MSDSYAFLNKRILYDSEQLAVSSTPVTLTAAKVGNTAGTMVPRKASAVLIQCLTSNVYYTLDGSTPSSSNGKRLVTNDVLGIAGYDKIAQLKLVRDTTDAVVHVDYYA